MRRVERGQPQIPWLTQRLARVNHIIHFAVILLGGGVDVLLGCLPPIKAVDVALAHVPFGLPLAMRHPLGNALAHPARMGNPRGHGRPQPFHMALAHNGVAIGRKGEHAIKTALKFRPF